MRTTTLTVNIEIVPQDGETKASRLRDLLNSIHEALDGFIEEEKEVGHLAPVIHVQSEWVAKTG